MKTKMICLFLTLWIARDGLTQTTDPQQGSQPENLKQLDSILGREYLPAEAYSYKFNKLFRMTDLGENTAGLNHFVSADIKEGKFALNLVLNTKQGSNFSFKLQGGATDGIFPIVRQSKLNSSLTADVNYNRLLKSSTQLSFYDEDFQVLMKSTNIRDLTLELQTIDKSLQQLKARKNKVNRDLTKDQIATLKFRKDTLADQQLANLDKLQLTRIKYKTLQFGLRAENNRFNLFNSSYADLESQLARKSNINLSAKIQLNSYYWHEPHKRTHSRYWLVGAALTYEDNFSDLDEVEVTDQQMYADSTTSRTVAKKTTAYRGNYKTKLPGGRLYGDLYLFDSKNVMALHLYPEINLRESQDPFVNMGIGIYFAFAGGQTSAKPEDKISKVNAELYYQLSDLSNTYNSPSSTFKRAEVGIRLSFPIAFVNP